MMHCISWVASMGAKQIMSFNSNRLQSEDLAKAAFSSKVVVFKYDFEAVGLAR